MKRNYPVRYEFLRKCLDNLKEKQYSNEPAPILYPNANKGLEEKIKSEDNDKMIIPYKN